MRDYHITLLRYLSLTYFFLWECNYIDKIVNIFWQINKFTKIEVISMKLTNSMVELYGLTHYIYTKLLI